MTRLGLAQQLHADKPEAAPRVTGRCGARERVSVCARGDGRVSVACPREEDVMRWGDGSWR